MVEKIGEGIQYRRRTDGFTLFVDNSQFSQPDQAIHISDDTFEVLLMVHERYTRKLDRIDDPGYEKGGLVQ